MATTTVSIGSNQSISTVTLDSCSSGGMFGGPWDVTFTSTPSSNVAIGDIYVIFDENYYSTWTFLVTAISGSTYTLKYLTDDGALGDMTPCDMVNESYEQASGTFKRAFSTITLFEAMVDDASPTYWGSTDDVVGECHADSPFTDSRVYFSNKQSLASVKLTVNSDDRHDGTADSGVVIRPTAGAGHNNGIIDVNIDNFIMEWIEIDLDSLDAQNTNKAVALGGTNDDNIIRNNIIHDKGGNPGGSGPTMIHMPTNALAVTADNLYIFNNLIYNVVETGGDHATAININRWAGSVYLYNNTIWNITSNDSGSSKYAYGIIFGYVASSASYLKNNIVSLLTNGPRAYYKVNAARTSVTANNLSDDTTSATYDAEDMGQALNDSSALIGKTLAQIDFVSTVAGSEDLHLDTDSVCREAGVDLGTTNGVNIDIDGFDRDAGGVVWDIGADQTANEESSTGNPAFLLFLDI
jgi:hypothetical protein|tara:strand:+ start:1397 stop:2797 length:1401 start_codon:yes stop_codon:yes gene_type:complete